MRRTRAVNDGHNGKREVNLVIHSYQISAVAQMLMEVGEMAQVLIEACCHQLHHLGPLAYSGHEIALSAHGGVEVDVVAVLILALKEAGIKENVRAGRLHPERILCAGELAHHELGDLCEVRELTELLIAGVVVGGENFGSIDRLQAEVTEDACEIYASRVADLGPLLTSYRLVEI